MLTRFLKFVTVWTMNDTNTSTPTPKSKFDFKYICVSRCKKLALEFAQSSLSEARSKKFTRVSESFLVSCEVALKEHIRSRVKTHPSAGKTLTWKWVSAILTQRMIAYKLFRKRKDGSYGPLFINRPLIIFPHIWFQAEAHRTKGYAFRPGWHCCSTPNAPHLSMKGRVWCEVDIQDWEKMVRPAAQGGMWYLAKRLRMIGELWMQTSSAVYSDFSVDYFCSTTAVFYTNKNSSVVYPSLHQPSLPYGLYGTFTISLNLTNHSASSVLSFLPSPVPYGLLWRFIIEHKK